MYALRDNLDKKYLDIIISEIANHYLTLGVTGDNLKIIYYFSNFAPKFCPAEINNSPFHSIILNIVSTRYWSQTIYQVSHELTHYFIYSHNKNEHLKAKWIEETICESASLYFLKFFRDNWEKSQLYTYNSTYNKSINEYLLNLIFKNLGDKDQLESCKSYEDLIKLDNLSESNRELRKCTMLKLYDTMNKNDLIGLIHYKDFIIPDKKILDTKLYRNTFSKNKCIDFLCKIQDRIVNHQMH